MSQVRKFETGGTSSKQNKRTIKINGTDHEVDKIVLKLRKDHASDSEINQIVNGLESGTFTEFDNYFGFKTNSSSNARYSDEAYEKFRSAVDSAAKSSTTEDEPKKNKIDSEHFKKHWSNQGDLTNIETWLERDKKDENGKRAFTNRSSRLAEVLEGYRDSLGDDDDYTGSAYKDKNDYVTRLNNAIASLRNGTLDNDDFTALDSAFPNADINWRALFDDGTGSFGEKEPEKEKTEKEKYEEELAKLAQEEELEDIRERVRMARALRDFRSLWNQSMSENYQNREFDLSPDENFDNDKYLESIPDYGTWYKNLIDSINNNLFSQPNRGAGYYNKNATWSNEFGNRFKYLFDNHKESLYELGDGRYLLKDSVKDGSNIVVVYDPTRRKLIRTHISSLPEDYKEQLRQHRFNNYYRTYKVGGEIVKAQFGGDTLNFDDSFEKNYKELKKLKRKEDIKLSGKTEELFDNDNRKIEGISDFKGSDWTRIGAAIGDISGAIAAFIPGGSVYSFGQGIVSDFMRAGADIADGASMWDAGKGLLAGLGMTVLTSIPIAGTAGKLGKATSVLIKYLPHMFAVGSTLNTYKPAIKSYDNIKNDKATAEDYKNILNFVISITNVAKVGGAHVKSAAMKRAAESGTSNEITVKGKTKDYKLNSDQLTELKGAKTPAELQAKIKTITGDNNAELDLSRFSTNKVGGGWNPLRLGMTINEKSQTLHDWDKFRQINSGSNATWSQRGMVRDYDFMVNPKWLNWLPEFKGYGLNSVGISNPTTTRTVLPSTRTVLPSTQIVGAPSVLLVRALSQGSTPVAPVAPAIVGVPNVNNIRALSGFRQGGKLEYLIKLKSGGVIKALSGIQINKDRNWYDDVFSGYEDELIKRLANDKYYEEINKALKNHSNLYNLAKQNTNNNFQNVSWNGGKDVSDYQNWYQSQGFNNLGIAHAFGDRYLINGKRQDVDRQGNNWKSDGLYSSITDDRRVLGREEDWTDLQKKAAFDEKLKNAGYKMYLGDDGYYYLDKLTPKTTSAQTSTVTPRVVDQTQQAVQPATRQAVVGSGADLRNKYAANPEVQKAIKSLRDTSLYPITRFMLNQQNNNRVFNETQKGLKEGLTLTNPYRMHRQVVGDFFTQQAVKQNALKALRQARQMAEGTADGNLAAAQMNTAWSSVNQMNNQADATYNQGVTTSREANYAQEKENRQIEHASAEENRTRLHNLNKALRDLQAAKYSADHTNLDTLLSQFEYEAKTKKAQRDELAKQMQMLDYEKEASNLYKIYIENPFTEWKANTKGDLSTYQTTDEYKSNLNKYKTEIYNLKKHMLQDKYKYYLADGGVAARINGRHKNADRYSKSRLKAIEDVMKSINGLSKTTQKSILKALGLI